MEIRFQKNDIVTVEITDISSDGAGIGKVDGFTLFIKDAVMGDTVTAKIMKVKKGYGFARLTEIVAPSPFRTAPRCELARKCGGCQIQELSYDRQLSFKQKRVRDVLLRIGGFSEETVQKTMHPILGMEDPYRFRNKEQLPVGEKDGRPVAGFYAGHTHCIVPVTDCLVGPQENQDILAAILKYMEEYHVPAYREETGTGLVRHILIRSGIYSRETMVCLVINGGKLPQEEALIACLQELPGMSSICININTERTNVIMGRKGRTLWGKEAIEDTMHVLPAEYEDDKVCFGDSLRSITYRISPLSFYQVNPVQAERLYSIVRCYAGLTGTEVVWDLYCGVGTIGCFLAEDAGEVYGVEVIPDAIRDARKNAEKNGISNITFCVGKAEEVLPEYVESKLRAAGKTDKQGMVDVVVVDPPRKGCDEVCLRTILETQPERIVYVSCDPATMARDCKILAAGGYELKEIQAVDQFPHTVHVETCVLLVRECSHDDEMVSIKVDMDGISLKQGEYKPDEKPTYGNIKKWIKEKYGFNVTSLYIGQIKDKVGIKERKNYNIGSGDGRVPNCPPEKEEAITEAFRHFGLI